MDVKILQQKKKTEKNELSNTLAVNFFQK